MASTSLQQGVSRGKGWALTDRTTGLPPASIAGLTAKSQVRADESVTSTLLYEFDARVQEIGGLVYVTIQWTAAESLLWDWDQGNCDVILLKDGEPIQIVWEGVVIVNKVVTSV